MIDAKALLDDLKKQVENAEADLNKQVKALPEVNARLRAEYDQARKLGRTAATWNSWLGERVTQVAVAWILGTVFVRFCEDNGLIPEPYLASPDPDRRDLVQARYEAYVDEEDDPTYRGWLERAFAELGEGQAGRLLFNKDHNPLFQVPLSHDAAGSLVEFWRARDEQSVLVHDFTDPLNSDGAEGWNTRFLGDLYQDLSEAARSTYALLQTPEFVEEFILDRTMDPAVREFGHKDLKMIDPTCGSGHFVLGAFHRLVRLWADRDPGRTLHERVEAALDSVHGVDLNPFAVAIARFRLLVAAMAAANIRSLAEASKYEWPIHLAIGDSLIKDRQLELAIFDGEIVDPLSKFAYDTEDIQEHPHILEPGRYHIVVGNPPYITVKDKKLNLLYRDLYNACSGKYALSVPFAQRFFELAKRGNSEGHGYGMVGQITANSFMKREFGAKLIEQYFAHQVELTEVIDTSGAYIPGHGTPTVILIGRSFSGKNRSKSIRTVRSVQGEPFPPEKAENGLVWRSIVDQIDNPGTQGQWVSVDDLDRRRYFTKQPWILTDGGLEMIEEITKSSTSKISDIATEVGISAVTGEDDLYLLQPNGSSHRNRLDYSKSMITGDLIRDHQVKSPPQAVWVYDDDFKVLPIDRIQNTHRYLSPYRALISKRHRFGTPMLQRGLTWYEWQELYPAKLRTPLTITFAEVATHNHFTLDQGGRVFNRTAPVIKLPERATEDDHLELLGLLNSSTSCLWLKLNCHDKGNRGGERSTGRYAWENYFQFNGSNIERFPLPGKYPTEASIELNELARQLTEIEFSSTNSPNIPSVTILHDAKNQWKSIRARMITLQEELDWQVYSIYNLHSEDLRAPKSEVPELALGERAFEIVLARRVAKGEASGEWFERHGSTPITEIPSHWPDVYKEVVQKRIDVIETSRAIGMIERPEYKRRWATEGWDSLQEKALKAWLLDRIEARQYWFDANDRPTLISLSRLTEELSQDEDFVNVAALYSPHEELTKVVSGLMADEHVPFLAALRYKPSGLKKREDWEHVWDLQRQEDAAPDEPSKRKIRDSIPVPPKYGSADFRKPSYARARGKLDVPKERFISYPTALGGVPELYGWAGWDHREQGLALAAYLSQQQLSAEEVTPFLAGLLELQPWLDQWHHEVDLAYGASPADAVRGLRQQLQGQHGLTDDDLRAWRPPAATRRQAAKKS